jgi:hypothetical protein
VRTTVLQDTIFEGAETFALNVTNPAGVTSTGTGTIVDDGTGDKFPDAPPSSDGTPPKGPGPFDDDRALRVNSITVNEGSPFAVFTVSGSPGQQATLALAAGTAGAADFGPGLEVWNGTSWIPYTGGPVTLDASGKLLVRTPVLQDAVFEGAETFSLNVTNTAGVTSAGTGTIVDDGTGDKFPDAVPTQDGTPPKGPGPFDDDRTLTVNSITVNEASPFAVFTVSGAAGQLATLSLAGGTASAADFGPGLEVWNGSAWVPYSGGTVTVGSSGRLLVRTPVLQDTVFEGPEAFSLTATTTSGKATSGTGTIVDDGTGDKFPDAPPTPEGTPPKGPGPFDDDRSLAVNSITVNEGSPFAVFTVSGAAGQQATLVLSGGSAGPADFGPSLEVWNGSAWVPYSGGPVTLDASGKLLVRTPVLQDTVFEGPETFSLTATTTSGKAASGSGTIVDDGTGDKFPDAPPTPEGTPPKGPGPFDDDRALRVNSITVNEGSPFAVFTVSGSPGQQATLALASGSAGSADFGPSLEVWNGTAWVPYNGGPVTIGATGSLLVRTTVLQDTIFEGAETFSLTATNTGGRSASGTGTIVDDGTGDKFPDAPPSADGTPPKGPGPFDDDRALTVSSPVVNEASPFAVFKVSGSPGQIVALKLSDGTASGSDYGPALEFFDGTAWKPLTGPVPLDSTGGLLVRTPIKQDTLSEGAETFTLTATNTGGRSASGTGTIVDDGTGDLMPNSPPTPDGKPAVDTVTPKDDDRPLSVNQITVSEASPFAVFTVTGQPGQRLKLALESGTATVGTDTGSALQFFDGSAWRDYTPGSLVTIPAGGTQLLVRVAIVNDKPLEGRETFQLRVTGTGGNSATGTATIADDGTSSNVFEASNASGRATQGVADDDTPPPPPPAPPPPAPQPPKQDAAPTPAPAPAPAPAPTFDSAVAPTKPSSLPLPDRPNIGEIVTSSSGFPIRVIESEKPALMRDKGITDQFIDPGRATTFNLPADAFAHTRAEAVLTLVARQTNGQPLPPWVMFNPQSGTFMVTPPPGFTGEIEIQVIARDNDGREASANFKFNVGSGAQRDGQSPADRPATPQPGATPPRQGHLGITEQIRLASRPAGATLIERVMASRAVQERLAEIQRSGGAAPSDRLAPANAAGERPAEMVRQTVDQPSSGQAVRPST